MVLDRTDFSDRGGYCDGVQSGIRFRMIRGGRMREAIIIGTILILAVILWKPRKGGRG